MHQSVTVLRETCAAVLLVVLLVLRWWATRARRRAVAELAEARDEAARRQAFTDAMLETIDVGIVSCGPDGTVLLRNRAERELLGVQRSSTGPYAGVRPEVVAGAALPVFHLDGRLLAASDYPLTRALRGEPGGPVGLRMGAPGPGQREVVATARRISADDGTVLGAVVAVTDVTADRQTQRSLAAERRRLTEAQRLGQLGSFTYEVATGTYSYSAELLRIWGVDAPDLLTPRLFELLHEDDRHAVRRQWQAAVTTGGRSSVACRIRRPSGQVRHLRVDLDVDLDGAGRPAYVHGATLDVTEITDAEREARQAGAKLEAILAASPDFTFIVDLASGAVVYGSEGKDVCGMSSGEVMALGTSASAALVHPEDLLRLRATNVAAGDLEDGQVLQIRYRVKHTQGHWCWLSRRITPFRRDASGTVVEALGVVRDVTDTVEAEERLTHSALHDALTGLPNRALLMDRLDAALGRAGQRDREVAVLFVDLDGFKRVNDTAGHAAGDAVLVVTADRLRAALRAHDTIARVGGDEFVLIVEPWERGDAGPDASAADRAPDDRALAVALAERVQAALSCPIEVGGVEHVVTASIGITYAGRTSGSPTGPATGEEVLRDADAAMYRAKHLGKDRFEVFQHALRTDLAERGRVEQALRRALSTPGRRPVPGPRTPVPGPGLTAAYQPVVDGGTGALVGFEALARLRGPAGEQVPPEVFIAVAEATAQIRQLGALMLDVACGQLAAWRERRPGLTGIVMSVNVSALQAQHTGLADGVHRVLARHGLEPGDLVLELTETALLQATRSTMAALQGLREDGVGIAIDDFGVGYASLRYLATLPVSAVKVDRSFTAGLPHDRTCCTIVGAVAGLAADLGLGCVVEGVETVDQRAALPPGVQLQGYLTGRPAAADDVPLAELLAGPAALV